MEFVKDLPSFLFGFSIASVLWWVVVMFLIDLYDGMKLKYKDLLQSALEDIAKLKRGEG